MRKRLFTTLAVAALATVVIGSLALSSTASPGSPIGPWGRFPGRSYTTPEAPRSHEGGQTIVLTGRTANFAFVDVGRRGESAGDYFVLRDRLFRRGRNVGAIRAQCTANFPFTGFRQALVCQGVATLFGSGQIAWQGARVFTPTTGGIDLGITGGTEHWQNVRGEIHVRFISEEATRYIFHLLP